MISTKQLSLPLSGDKRWQVIFLPWTNGRKNEGLLALHFIYIGFLLTRNLRLPLLWCMELAESANTQIAWCPKLKTTENMDFCCMSREVGSSLYMCLESLLLVDASVFFSKNTSSLDCCLLCKTMSFPPRLLACFKRPWLREPFALPPISSNRAPPTNAPILAYPHLLNPPTLTPNPDSISAPAVLKAGGVPDLSPHPSRYHLACHLAKQIYPV